VDLLYFIESFGGEKMLYVTASILCMLLAVAIHELGHYGAMREVGIRVRDVSLIGFPIPRLPNLRLSWTRGETAWHIHPIPIGGFVRAHDFDPGRMRARDTIYVIAAGPIANLAAAAIAWFLRSAYLATVDGLFERSVITMVITGGIVAALWVLRKRVGFVLPLLGLVALVMIMQALFGTPTPENVNSPRSVVYMPDGVYEVMQVFKLFLIWNIAVGLFNLMPLGILDGGKIIQYSLIYGGWQKSAAWFEWATVPLVVLLILILMGNDIYKAFISFFS
jgi:membrane-associated protease RseP (regulator of RpoE activity)